MAKQSAQQHTREDKISEGAERSRLVLHQHSSEIQPSGRIAKLPIALEEKSCTPSIDLARADSAEVSAR